jgi:hypothetical protein
MDKETIDPRDYVALVVERDALKKNLEEFKTAYIQDLAQSEQQR